MKQIRSETAGSETLSERSAFLGRSEPARAVRKAIVRAARADGPVLIHGESGVGKELVAREIHVRSARGSGPCVPINCAAIPDSLIESELFGHRPGAFTDARGAHRGAFELAHGGTLFLDEVGDLSPVAQPKLLRAIETKELLPVGGERPIRVDLRIIAATNHNLRAMRRDGRFRADLYYRLRVIELPIPPLRDRREDVPELVEHFARVIAERSGRPFSHVDPEAMTALAAHPWPGNVRQLKAVIEGGLAMSSGMVLDGSCLRLDPGVSGEISIPPGLRGDWREAKRKFETALARTLLADHEGDVYKAARAAGLSPRSLYKILRRLGLRPGPRSR